MNAIKIEDVSYTIKDIFALPQGQRAELINGDMYMMAPPKLKHQRLLSKLNTIINNYIDRKGGKCEAIPAPFGVFLEENDENYVEPDLSVICDTAKLQDDGCHGAPDWVIEIVSPASRKMDCFIKQEKYRKAGVREYWIVDPETNIIRVFRYEKGEMKDYPFTEDIPVGIYEDLTINLSKLL